MKDNCKGKKLLILGGGILSKDIVLTAKSMGIYTIVTDWYDIERSPVKLLADEYWDVSIEDYDTLAKKIVDNNVDGVFTSFTDSYLLPYQHLCEKMGFFFYGSKEAFENSVDKYKFKRMCERHGVPVVPEYQLDSFDPSVLSENNAIVIKPVDNSGARGVTYCDNEFDFKSAIENALSFSPHKKVILEKFISNKGTTMSVRYIAVNGKLYLHLVGDRYVLDDTKGKAMITAASFYPSKHSKYYIENFDHSVSNMFEDIGVENGAFFMESFCDGKSLYFYEMGMRLSGAMTYNITKTTNDVNELEMLLQYSLSGRMCDEENVKKIDPYLNGRFAASISFPLKAGKISSINGFDLIIKHPKVYSYSQRYNVGDVLDASCMGTLFQLFGRVSLIADNKQDLIDCISFIIETLSIKDENGEEMFISAKLYSILNDYIA